MVRSYGIGQDQPRFGLMSLGGFGGVSSSLQPFSLCPAVWEEHVYVGCLDGYVYALDTRDGRKKWEFPTGGFPWSSPVVSDGLVFIGTVGGGNRLHRPPGTVANGKVYALDSRTGRMVWEFEAVGGVPSSPAVWGGLVFIATNEGYLYALDARNGRIAWEQEDDSPYPIISSPAVWVPGSLE